MAEKNNKKNDNKTDIKAIIKEYIINFIVIGGFILLILKFVAYPVYIPSESMVPTLQVKDKLIVTKVHNTANLKRGDIVTFRCDEFGNNLLIKRLIGLPGDKIEIKEGEVFVNGKKLTEPYVKYNDDDFEDSYEVPQGKYFFLGDNRDNSDDSRYWHNSFVDSKDIDGKAFIRFYPFNKIGKIK